MKIVFRVPADGGVQITSDDKDNVVQFDVTPEFRKKNGTAVVLTVECYSAADKLLDEFELTVSGQTGKVARGVRAGAVKPAVDCAADPAS